MLRAVLDLTRRRGWAGDGIGSTANSVVGAFTFPAVAGVGGPWSGVSGTRLAAAMTVTVVGTGAARSAPRRRLGVVLPSSPSFPSWVA